LKKPGFYHCDIECGGAKNAAEKIGRAPFSGWARLIFLMLGRNAGLNRAG
jgi:hypothetical protein